METRNKKKKCNLKVLFVFSLLLIVSSIGSFFLIKHLNFDPLPLTDEKMNELFNIILKLYPQARFTGQNITLPYSDTKKDKFEKNDI